MPRLSKCSSIHGWRVSHKDLVEDIRELSDDVARTATEAFKALPPYTWKQIEPGDTK